MEPTSSEALNIRSVRRVALLKLCDLGEGKQTDYNLVSQMAKKGSESLH
jgi:hypothetical protein